MEVTNVAAAIEKRINALEEGRRLLDELSLARAAAVSEYDRAIAVTLIKLRGGEEFELDGHKIKDPPTTIIDKIAKGMCWQNRLFLEESEAKYRAALTKLDVLQAQLMGYQSIYRHLQEA